MRETPCGRRGLPINLIQSTQMCLCSVTHHQPRTQAVVLLRSYGYVRRMKLWRPQSLRSARSLRFLRQPPEKASANGPSAGSEAGFRCRSSGMTRTYASSLSSSSEAAHTARNGKDARADWPAWWNLGGRNELGVGLRRSQRNELGRLTWSANGDRTRK